MNRDVEIEQRIQMRKENDLRRNINSYGGMGMDGISGVEKTQLLEELEYMKTHPSIYKSQTKIMTPFSLFSENVRSTSQYSAF